VNAEGLGYAHTMSPPRHPASPRQPVDRDSAISQRWETRWLPWCAIAAKRDADPANALAQLKVTHRSRCVNCMNAGLAWTTILRSEIDSPLNGEVWFNAMLRLSVERRRSRMGRRKGYSKNKKKGKVDEQCRP
jgi:hypothetical protein